MHGLAIKYGGIIILGYQTPTWKSSQVYDLYHNSWQYQILNPLSEVRDQTCNLMVTSWICLCWSTTGTPRRYLWPFRATLSAYGRSQARDRIGATAAGLHHSHSHAGSKPCL